MEERPESVTVIGWLLIVIGALGLLGCLAMASMQDLPIMQRAMAAYHYPVSYHTMLMVRTAYTSGSVLCGVAFLQRLGWARYVFALGAAPMMAYTLWIAPWAIFVIPSILLTIAAVAFLFRPAANRWFAGSETPPPSVSEP